MGKEVKETQEANEPKSKDPQQKKNRVLVVILITVIAILGIIIYMLLNPKKENTEKVVTPKNVKAIQEQIDQGPSPDSQYTVEMNSTWNVNAATATADNAYVKNAEENQRTVFFDVSLANTNEVLYKSDYLTVGDYVQGITLTKQLDPGTYTAALTYHLVDDNNKEITTTSVYVTLNVS